MSSSSPFLGFVVMALITGAFVWFFRGPAKAADKYVDSLASQFQSPQDAALFRNVYRTKGPKSTTLAWILTVFLSPTVSYIYQGKWGQAAIALITFQGLFFWWIVSIFSMPFEVLGKNKRLADEAFNQVMIGRGAGSVMYVQSPNPVVAADSGNVMSESPAP